MTCPDPIALARTNSPDADPEVVEHLENCPSCWLDWQIQQGPATPSIPKPKSSRTHERAIARIERKARELEEATRWWDLPILGVLVAIAAFAFFLAGGNAGPRCPWLGRNRRHCVWDRGGALYVAQGSEGVRGGPVDGFVGQMGQFP